MRQNFWSRAGVLLVMAGLLAGCNSGGSDHAAATPAAGASGNATSATSPPQATSANATATAATKPTARPTVANTPVPTLASYGVTLGNTTFEGVEADYHYLGSENAPVTLNHYADYVCRDCADYVLNIEPQLIQNEVKAGRLKIVYRPVVRYGNLSERAAEAAECAAESGRFWEMRYGLFQRQNELFSLQEIDPLLSGLARLANIQPAPFAECLKERETLPGSLAQSSAAEHAGIEVLPVYEINGQRLTGKVTLEQLRDFIATAGAK